MRPIAFLIRAGAVVALLAFVFSLLDRDEPLQAVGARQEQRAAIAERKAERAREQQRQKQVATAAQRRAKEKAAIPRTLITITAVGDIVMGNTPNLPPDGGRSFFEDVQSELAADIVLGNLEGTLTNAAGSKCAAANSSNCFAFKMPPSYARWLKQAGFTVLNLANNHAFDFGKAGLQETVRALEARRLLTTGRPGQIAEQMVGKARVAILGFAPYPWAQSLTDIPAAKKLVRKAAKRAELVIVTFHGGAEGSGHQHVTPGTEFFLGENRGNVVRFSRAVIDAGADVVIGHGPHVLRGMEWYKGRLIAYSLGNFGGYKVFSLGGPLSVSGILRLTLRGDGTFETGILVPTKLGESGIPELDPSETAHGLVRRLSKADFGGRAVKVAPTGVLGR